MVANLSTPLPLGECRRFGNRPGDGSSATQEGPAAARRWEGEGTSVISVALPSGLLALSLPRFAWAPPSPLKGEGL